MNLLTPSRYREKGTSPIKSNTQLFAEPVVFLGALQYAWLRAVLQVWPQDTFLPLPELTKEEQLQSHNSFRQVTLMKPGDCTYGVTFDKQVAKLYLVSWL